MNTLNILSLLTYCKLVTLQAKAANKLKEERGDTNFLSIIIILAIVLVIAVVFIAFKDEIIGLLSDAWDSFSDAFGNQTNSGPSGP